MPSLPHWRVYAWPSRSSSASVAGMNVEPLLTSPTDLRGVTDAAQQSAIRAYRDGFISALVAVNNAASAEFGGQEEYAAAVRAIAKAQAQLDSDLAVALDGERIYW